MNRTKHGIKGKEWRRGSGDIEEINTRNTASQCAWPCLLAAQMLFPSRSGDASNRKGGFSGTFNGIGFKLYPIWTLRRRKTLVVHLCNVALLQLVILRRMRLRPTFQPYITARGSLVLCALTTADQVPAAKHEWATLWQALC